jgi:hypothetical protein
LMLSTVISVLMIRHGNHASASAWTMLHLCQEAWKDSIALAKQKNTGIVFTHCFLHRISKSVVPEIQKVLDETIKSSSRVGHYNWSCLQHCVLPLKLLTYNFNCTWKCGGYLEGEGFQGSMNRGKVL